MCSDVKPEIRGTKYSPPPGDHSGTFSTMKENTMGILGLLKLEGADFAAFVLAGLAGYATGTLVSDVEWSIYASILVSYHLFLTWLILSHSEKTGLAMPLWATVLTHSGCMVLVVTPATVIGRTGIVHLLFRYGIVGLALFERNWLFSKEQPMKRPEDESPAVSAEPRLRSTAEDELAWLEYLKTRRPGMTKPGVTIRQEHEAWLLARHQQRLNEQALQQARQPQTAQ